MQTCNTRWVIVPRVLYYLGYCVKVHRLWSISKTIGNYAKAKRLEYLDQVWQANNKKGYITEMEATAMLKLAKDWHVENELIEMVRK